ncbi:MAG: EAL domain-containing protein [Xanthomonadales bacterium]|nr:EAL domain-containing protein [Xanthomonadales bacterium]
MEAVPEPVLVLDGDGRILEANPAACEFLRQPPEELLATPISRLLRPCPPGLPASEATERDAAPPRRARAVLRRGDGSDLAAELCWRSFAESGERRAIVVLREASPAPEPAANADRSRELALLDGLPLGVLVEDALGRVLHANASARELLGLGEQDPPSLDALLARGGLVDVEGRRLGREDLPSRIALARRAPVRGALLAVLDPDRGGRRWLQVSASPRLEDQGAGSPLVVSVIEDVTPLQRDRELFARAQRLARIAGFEWWPAADRVLCTPQWNEIFGIDLPAELRLEAFLARFAADDRPRLVEALAEALRRPSEIAIECRVSARDGRRCWVRLLLQAIRLGGEAAHLAGTAQDITEEKLREEDLRIRSDTDLLTGLLSREAILRAVHEQAANPLARIAVLHLDVDRFKLVNEVFGHEAGDRMLAAVGARLRAALGARAQIGRLTGDEFLIVLGDELARRAESIAELLVRAFDRPFRHGEQEIPLGVSIGLARYPDDASDVRELLTRADGAMHQAKRRGRKGWLAVSASLARELAERVTIESHLRRALELGELRLLYQPKVDLRTGRVTGAEALLRWHSPQLGTVAPDRFVPHAEASGEIVRIGRWVIDQACAQLAAWRRAGIALEQLAVNLSYRQLMDTRVADEVLRALFEQQLQGELLEVEITERILTEEVEDVRPVLQALRAAGVSIAIDDFGEGYSALDRLRRLPIQALKISHRFTAGVPHIAGDVAICQAIIGVARSLGLEVVAEGVENEAQRGFMQRQGVRLAQGFLFARPLAAEEFAQFYRERRAGG